jgi:hypothetical protein
MKTVKLLVLCATLACTALAFTGCASCNKCCPKTETKSACGMKCCEDGKTTCATCPTCSAKK